jgi:hypothetical protein
MVDRFLCSVLWVLAATAVGAAASMVGYRGDGFCEERSGLQEERGRL